MAPPGCCVLLVVAMAYPVIPLLLLPTDTSAFPSGCCVLLIAVFACPVFGLLGLPNLPSLTPTSSSSGSCNNGSSDALSALLSPNSTTAAVFEGAIRFLDKTLICLKTPDAEERSLLTKINIYLFYGPKTTDCQIESLANVSKLFTGGHWNSSRSAVLFVPGWTNSATSEDYCTEIIKAYAANGSYTLMILDWYAANNQFYTKAVAMVGAVGRRVAQALDEMAGANSTFRSITLVGHSLGAHVSGFIGRSVTRVIVPFLGALDPAGPLFYTTMLKCVDGVSSTDAQFVMSIHSDWNRFGGNENVGVVDYMPNNGTFIQPGCTQFDANPAVCSGKFLCSHKRSLFFWCAALKSPGSVLGRKCPSASHFAAGRCKDNPTLDVTQTTLSEPGMYFFTTNGKDSFGRGLAGT